MIRRFYALPEDRLGCNTVEYQHLHHAPDSIVLEARAGTATLSGGTSLEVSPGRIVTIGAVVDPETFQVTPDVNMDPRRVEDPAAFDAWFGSTYLPTFADPDDTPRQQEVSGIMMYLWLQDEGLLADPNE